MWGIIYLRQIVAALLCYSVWECASPFLLGTRILWFAEGIKGHVFNSWRSYLQFALRKFPLVATLGFIQDWFRVSLGLLASLL